MPFRYPVALELQGRRCVVIGGGQVAEQRANALLAAGADVAVVGDSPTDGLEELARAGLVELIRRRYHDGDLEAAYLAVSVEGEAALNAEIFEEAEERRVLLNSMDDVEHCHFAIPSIVRRGDWLLAISTGGKAPALSKRLRLELSEQFGPEWGTLVELLARVREATVGEREADFDTWAARWQLALDRDLLGLVREGRLEEAAEWVHRCLTEGPVPDDTPTPSPPRGRGRVAIVGAGPGDPGLITVRGKELLDAADVVVYDRLVDPSLIEGKLAIYAGKEAGRHSFSQAQINRLLVRLALEGNDVVRLKGGDPFVFGRGGEEAHALAGAGIDFEVVPAPTSAIAAPAYAGIPVTDRRVASSVAFVTGHCAGREVDWRRLATAVDTIVVLMGLRKLDEIARELIGGGRAPSTPAAVIEHGTLPSQRVVTAELEDLAAAAAEAGIGSPALIVVGEVVRLREGIEWFRQALAGVL